jgi:hypothetical protein
MTVWPILDVFRGSDAEHPSEKPLASKKILSSTCLFSILYCNDSLSDKHVYTVPYTRAAIWRYDWPIGLSAFWKQVLLLTRIGKRGISAAHRNFQISH